MTLAKWTIGLMAGMSMLALTAQADAGDRMRGHVRMRDEDREFASELHHRLLARPQKVTLVENCSR